MSLSSFFTSLTEYLPTAHAEEASQVAPVSESTGSKGEEESEVEEAPKEDEEEDEEEPEDLAPGIRDACAAAKPCSTFKHHFDECTERITSGKTEFAGENCVEELFHFMHCVDDCSAGKVFASLK